MEITDDGKWVLTNDFDEAMFHEAFRKDGGIVTPNEKEKLWQGKVLQAIRPSIGYFIKHNPKLPNVYINLIHNPGLGAKVAMLHDKYYIGIRLGSVYILTDLFARMLSTNKVLTEYGDVNKENSEPKKIFNAQNTNSNFLPHEEDLFPKDEVRRNLVIHLVATALNHLVFHEYGHIKNGHVGFQNKEKKEYDLLSNLSLQTLEFDADSSAIKMSFQDILIRSDNPNINKAMKIFYKDLDASTSLMFFSIYSLFRLTSRFSSEDTTIKRSSHPLSGIRQRTMMETLYQVVIKTHNEVKALHIINIIAPIINSVEQAFDIISEQGVDKSAIKLAFQSESTDHINQILAEWEILKPKLEKYAYCKLAP